MIHAKRHIPNFIDIDAPPERAVAETLEELLKTEWIDKYTKWKEFHRFCQSKDGEHLMIEGEDGTWWWVVAYLSGDPVDLPIVRMVRE